jgi:signal peptidase I
VFVAVDAYIISRKTTQSSSGKFKKWAKFAFICILLIGINLTVQGTIRERVSGKIKAYKIPAGSMEPALLIGDHIIVDLSFYKDSNPQRGDVIVFEYPEDSSKDFIKRVIAVEGEQIYIKDKKIFINGRQIEDPWGVYRDPNVISGKGSEMSRDNFGQVTVPANAFFVMGDNRDKSFDSHFWGYVHLDKVKGKALYIYWSWEGFFEGIRWNRIGKLIN